MSSEGQNSGGLVSAEQGSNVKGFGGLGSSGPSSDGLVSGEQVSFEELLSG